MSGVSKIVAEKNHRILLELVSQPGNDVCADCKGRAPRWASHNLGIFLCVRCASIHRKIGTHITKVKSLTLDEWSKEQVENMKNIGNIKANQMWNPDEIRNRPPTNMEESERDSELEKYIRSKYEYKRFRDKEKHLSQRAADILGPSQSKASLNPPARSKTAPIRSGTTPQPSSSAATTSSISQTRPSLSAPSTSQTRSASAGIPSVPSLPASFSSGSTYANQVSMRTPSANPFPHSVAEAPANQQASLNNDTFNDLISIQAPSVNTTLPLQFQPTSSFGQQLQAQMSSPVMTSPPSTFAGGNPYANLSVTPTGPGPAFPSSFDRSPNFRSASLPVFGQGTPASSSPLTMTATGMNPFQQQQQQTFGAGSADFSSPIPGSYAHNPFNAQFLQQQQQQQMFSPSAFSPQPQATGMGGLQATPSPFRQTPSPFATTNPGAFQPSPQPSQMPMQAQQMPMQQMQAQHYSAASNSPYSQQMQQAQQLFQNMQMGGSSNNPFDRQFG